MKQHLLILISFLLMQQQLSAQCNAAFNFTTNNDHANFTAAASGQDLYHGWLFGDGSSYWSGTSPTVEHTYNPGTYLVKHIIQDSVTHCADTITRAVTISFVPQCNAFFTTSLAAHFTWGDQYNIAPHYTFNGTTYAATYTLDGQPLDMLYVNLFPGTHQICLSFQTTAGCTSSYCKTIVVAPPVSCNLNTSFTATPSATDRKQVHFVPQPLLASANYYWDFGDGTSGSEPQPLHNYLNFGTYAVKLTVIDTVNNCIDSTARVVVVAPAPTDSCSVFFHSMYVNYNTRLFLSSVNQQAISFQWFIDSIPFSTESNPFHTFPEAGTYNVCMIATTASGCHAWYCDTVTIVDSSGRNNAQRIVAYPNPVTNGNIKLDLHLDKSATVVYKIYNSFGMPVFSKQEQVMQGNRIVSLPVQQLPAGQYFIEIMYDGQKKKSVFLKL